MNCDHDHPEVGLRFAQNGRSTSSAFRNIHGRLTLLGVRREDVYHEYMRSNESVDAQSQRQKVREQSGHDVYGLSSLDPIVVKMLMGTDPSYLEAAFHEIDAKYGSFDAYTREGLRISSAQVTQLRKNLVE